MLALQGYFRTFDSESIFDNVMFTPVLYGNKIASCCGMPAIFLLFKSKWVLPAVIK